MSGLKIVVCDHGIDLTQAQCLICQSPQLAEAKARIAALEARCAELTRDLAECYRLSGADPDGNEDWRLAGDAVSAVKELRKDYDEACERELALETRCAEAERERGEATKAREREADRVEDYKRGRKKKKKGKR